MQQPLKLSELTHSIQQTISAAFGGKVYWVIAETSNVKFYPAKNYYFLDLVEKNTTNNTIRTTIKASAWGVSINNITSFERSTGQKFESNVEVLLKVSIDYHVMFGLKVNILDIDHSFTIGKLEKQKQATLFRLTQDNPDFIQFIDGEFNTYNKSLQINPVIQRIALISSANSDGHKDFLHELLHNNYGYTFTVDEYPSHVQGAGMDTHMIGRLIEIFKSAIPYDAVVIVRGGGSQSDFLMFDSYELAKAVAKFPIPIFTGIGHLLNESVVDMMAFKATKTPTKAAECMVAHNRNFEDRILRFQKEIVQKSTDLINYNSGRLSQLATMINTNAAGIIHENHLLLAEIKSSFKSTTKERINAGRQEVKELTIQLSNFALAILDKESRQLDNYRKFIRNLSPEAVLKRGYALVLQNGKVVTDPKKIEIGSTIFTQLATTQIESIVTSKNEIKIKEGTA